MIRVHPEKLSKASWNSAGIEGTGMGHGTLWDGSQG